MNFTIYFHNHRAVLSQFPSPSPAGDAQKRMVKFRPAAHPEGAQPRTCRPRCAYVALGFNSTRMMRRNVSSNLGAFPLRYSRSAALINV